MRAILGMLLILFYAVHGAVHLHRGEPYDLLWGCHLAALLVAFGLILRSATMNAIGLLWACFGLPLWIIDLATGGELIPTATLTHLGALVIGIYGVRLLGMPRGSAWKAVGAYFVLWLATRLLTPSAANINLAFRVQSGWEQRFPSYPVYFAVLLAAGTAIFVAGERALSRFIGAPPARRLVRRRPAGANTNATDAGGGPAGEAAGAPRERTV